MKFLGRIPTQPLKILLGIALFIVVIMYIGPSKIYDSLVSLQPFYLIFIFVLLAATIFLSPFSLIFLYLPIQQQSLSLRKFYHLRLATYIIGLFTPAKLGEFSILFLLKKYYKMNITPFFYITLLDKFITLFHTLVFSLIGFYFLIPHYNIIIFILILIGLFLLVFFGFNFFLRKIEKLVSKLFHGKKFTSFWSMITTFSKTYLSHHKSALFFNFFFSFFIAVLTAITAKVTYSAFHLNVPIIPIFLINSIIGLTSFVPLNFFGFGVKEVTSIYLYTLIGVPAEITTSGIILILFFRYAICFLYFSFKDLRVLRANLQDS